MLEEASVLLAQKKETEQKQQLLDKFSKHFLLSDEDVNTLTSSVEPVNEHFFQVLARVKQIHKDCELLLGYENQRLGLELMEQTTKDLDAGYGKLFNWTQREFKNLDLEDPQISGSIRRSLRALSERPTLFQNCLDSFAEARQLTVSDAFQKALTGSSQGAARAIEFSTHDPLRYIGDMLAWVHSATVSEMEALEGLFISDEEEISKGLHAGKAADPFAAPIEDEDAPFDGRAALNSLISRNMASVAHTLSQRIAVTIRNLSDPVDIYKAYNVLSFYNDMFMKHIRPSTKVVSTSDEPASAGSQHMLLSTLSSLQTQTFAHFQTAALESLHSAIDDSPTPDLAPPSALSETLAAFATIAKTRGPALTLTEFSRLYSTLLAPVLASCANLASEAAEQPNATSATQTIYKLNYLSVVRDALSDLAVGTAANKTRIEAAGEPVRHAKTEIMSLSTNLTDILSQTFIDTSGLGDLLNLIGKCPTPDQHSARRRKAHFLQEQLGGSSQGPQLEILAQRLDGFLAGALMDAQDDVAKLVDKSISVGVLARAVEMFCGKFEEAVDFLETVDEDVEREDLAKSMGKQNQSNVVNGEAALDGSGGDDDFGENELPMLREVYPRTVEEVEALLS